MAIELLVESDNIANEASQTAVGTPVALGTEAGRMRYAEARVTLTGTTTTSTSTYLALRLPSNAVLKYGTIQAIGTLDAPNVDVGVRQVASPNTLDDDAIIAALDIDDSGDHVFIGEISTQDTRKQMWEWAGLTVDPHGAFDIHLSLDADIVVAGVLIIKAYYVVD